MLKNICYYILFKITDLYENQRYMYMGIGNDGSYNNSSIMVFHS